MFKRIRWWIGKHIPHRHIFEDDGFCAVCGYYYAPYKEWAKKIEMIYFVALMTAPKKGDIKNEQTSKH